MLLGRKCIWLHYRENVAPKEGSAPKQCILGGLGKDLGCCGIVCHIGLHGRLLDINNFIFPEEKKKSRKCGVSVGYVTSRGLGVTLPVHRIRLVWCISVSISNLAHLGMEIRTQVYLAVVHFTCHRVKSVKNSNWKLHDGTLAKLINHQPSHFWCPTLKWFVLYVVFFTTIYF